MPRFNLLVWKLIFYKAARATARPLSKTQLRRTVTKDGRGLREKREEIYKDIGLPRGCFFPLFTHCYVDIVSPSAYLRAFRTILFAFSPSANWTSRFRLRVYPSPLSFLPLYLSPSFASTFNAPSLSLSLFPLHYCFSSRAYSDATVCYLLISVSPFVPVSSLYYIALLSFFTAVFRTRGDGTRRGGEKNRPRVPAVKRSFAREDTNFLPLSFSISNNSPEAKVKTRFSFKYQMKINYPRAGNLEALQPRTIQHRIARYIEQIHAYRSTRTRRELLCDSSAYTTRRCLSTVRNFPNNMPCVHPPDVQTPETRLEEIINY